MNLGNTAFFFLSGQICGSKKRTISFLDTFISEPLYFSRSVYLRFGFFLYPRLWMRSLSRTGVLSARYGPTSRLRHTRVVPLSSMDSSRCAASRSSRYSASS